MRACGKTNKSTKQHHHYNHQPSNKRHTTHHPPPLTQTAPSTRRPLRTGTAPTAPRSEVSGGQRETQATLSRCWRARSLAWRPHLQPARRPQWGWRGWCGRTGYSRWRWGLPGRNLGRGGCTGGCLGGRGSVCVCVCVCVRLVCMCLAHVWFSVCA